MSNPDQDAITYMLGMSSEEFEEWVDAGEYSDQNVIDLHGEAGRLRKELRDAWTTIREYGIPLMAAKNLCKEIDQAGSPKDNFAFRAIAKNLKVLVSLIDWKAIDSLTRGQKGSKNQ
ncbi:hypothetical protein QVE09_09590 [Paenibacillus sp. ClWae2A]|uniref:hypothetical protein n=1 Tax=Paenibacillus sp. ClWae2A TaxID=3057177 RepID=UPI0028F6B32D|nr:hypothetical protein [Paenibacillus sp. ClWae2A]MDT9719153.1 hypothetical protein [Paenibacillus sp. ClWae2A]